MTATLYLPPGYDKEKDGPLPCLIWAYPREFKSKDAAGQPSCSCLVLALFVYTHCLLCAAVVAAVANAAACTCHGLPHSAACFLLLCAAIRLIGACHVCTAKALQRQAIPMCTVLAVYG